MGYKYFHLHKLHTISVKVRHAEGELYVKMIEKEKSEEIKICRILLKASEDWTEFCEKISPEILNEEKVGTLLFSYHGSGDLEFLEFSLY